MIARYRPEIDGLRAIAVLSVLIYHLRLTTGSGKVLPGGFLGVDVFFVISGFLIASIIFGELQEGRGFSFAAFYERRARRILPALFVVMLVSTAPAVLILLPTEFTRYAQSLVASTAFVSNFFWEAKLQEYGAQSSLYEPFVHTWSLAVEEQFYILFPIAALALWRYVRRPGIVLGIWILGGLLFAEAFTRLSPSRSFFWPASRVWELLVGALLAYLALRRPETLRGFRLRGLLPGLGLALIVGSMFVVDLEKMNHPSFATVPVVVGTACVIWFAAAGEPATRLLSSAPLVGVGLVSYSLYLWHYPVFAFGRLLSAIPTPAQMAGWVAITFALTLLSYRFVERPFRDRRAVSRAAVVRSSLAAATAVAAFAAIAVGNDGFPDRFSHLAAVYQGRDQDNEYLKLQSWEPLNRLAGHDEVVDMNVRRPTEHEAKALWFKDPGAQHVLIVGDSHSKDIFNALYLDQAEFQGLEFARFGMSQDAPEDVVRTLIESPNFAAADVVVITFRQEPETIGDVRRLAREVASRKGDVILMGNAVEFPMIGNLTLFDWYARSHSENFDVAELEALAFRSRDLKRAETDAEIRSLAKEIGARYLDKSEYICSAAAQSCDIVGDGGEKMLYDHGHYTLAGVRAFGRRIHELGWFRPYQS